MNKFLKTTFLIVVISLLFFSTVAFAQATAVTLNAAKTSGEIVVQVTKSGTTNALRIFTKTPAAEATYKSALQGATAHFNPKTGNFIARATSGSLKVEANLISNAGAYAGDLAKLGTQMDQAGKTLETFTKQVTATKKNVKALEKAANDTSSWRFLKKGKANKAVEAAKTAVKAAEDAKTVAENGIKAVEAAQKAVVGQVDSGKTGFVSRKLFNLTNRGTMKTATKWGERSAKAGAKAAATIAGKKVAKTGAKGVIKTVIGWVILPATIVNSAFVLTAPHFLVQDAVPPTVSVDITKIVVTDDKNTHIFFSTDIEPNSELSIKKIKKFRDQWEESQSMVAATAEAVGTSLVVDAVDFYSDLTTRPDEEFLTGCDIELYSLNAAGEREEMIASSKFSACKGKVGRPPPFKWTLNQSLPVGRYQLVLFAHLDNSLILYNRESILELGSAKHYRELLQGVTVEQDILDAVKAKTGETIDPLIAKIMAEGIPADDKKSLTEADTGFSANSNEFMLKFFEAYSFSSGEKKNTFKLGEKEDIEIRFDFLYPVKNFFISINEKGNPEDMKDVVTEHEKNWPWPDGNPYFKQDGKSFYVLNNLCLLKTQGGFKPSGGKYLNLPDAITKEGVYELRIYFIQDKANAVLEPAAIVELEIIDDGPIEEVFTTGKLEIAIGNKAQIEAAGVSLKDYVKGLKVTTIDGELVASPEGGSGVGKIFLKRAILLEVDIIVIENITKSNINEIKYILEMDVPGYETSSGFITIPPNAEEVK